MSILQEPTAAGAADGIVLRWSCPAGCRRLPSGLGRGSILARIRWLAQISLQGHLKAHFLIWQCRESHISGSRELAQNSCTSPPQHCSSISGQGWTNEISWGIRTAELGEHRSMLMGCMKQLEIQKTPNTNRRTEVSLAVGRLLSVVS